MRYKVFGARTGLKVSEFALGTGMLGKAYGYGTEPDEALKILKGYAEAGGNLIDLSDAYQGGESERLVGSFVGKDRKRLSSSSPSTPAVRRRTPRLAFWATAAR